MSTTADWDWRSDAQHVRPQPNELSGAGGFPALGGGGRGVGAMAAERGILRPFNPISWFHPRGIYRVLARLLPRLPDVGGRLFLTFTINPLLFADPSAAFEHARQHLRRVFYRLRRGATWEGKCHVIDAPYCVKVEFHGNDWAHFHAVFLTRRFLPAGLLNELWGLGRTDVRRITNERFHYLLKYVTKGGGPLPEWVRNRSRLRVFQASHGFYKSPGTPANVPEKGLRQKKRSVSDSLGARIERHKRTAVFQSGEHFSQFILGAPFEEIHATEIYPAAEDGRYLGSGHYKINDAGDLVIWIIPKQ
jgi:hypothetical protein